MGGASPWNNPSIKEPPMAQSTKKIKWSLEADYYQACNCNYGCPCEFEAPPSMGYCEGMGAWRIRSGRYGKVKLDGLGLAFAAHWPKAIHEGNGTAALFIDEQADGAQREALLKIGSGEAGGAPFEIVAMTFAKVLEPQFVPFQFKGKGKTGRVSVGDKLVVEYEPIKNPVTGNAESIAVEHGTGFIFKKAECVSAKVNQCRLPGLSYSWPGKGGFLSKVKYGN